MTFARRMTRALSGCVMAGFFALPAGAAETVVHVSLWDRGHTPMMHGQQHMGLMGADMPMVMMGITVNRTQVPTGEVTFRVTNNSADMIHEMVVTPMRSLSTPLPYIRDAQRIDEDAAGHLGEVAELNPGQAGALTLTLRPGTYILYCNLPGHFAARMWMLLTVTA